MKLRTSWASTTSNSSSPNGSASAAATRTSRPGSLARQASTVAAKMLEKGVYVIGFFFPVVPRGKARIRTQVSAVHSREDLDFALQKFAEVKRELGI